MTTSRYVRLAATADVASLRTATYNDRPHLVVPIVALVGDAVVRPVNSTTPEFVPAEELAVAPQGWNGRPVVPDHPSDDSGIPVTANEPTTLEHVRFGELFHTKYEDRKLKTEAYIDINRALALGGDPAIVVSRLRAGEMIEVSVGAFVTAIDRHGVAPNGDEYDVVWSNIVPDHLAILPDGTTGACSIEDGCGAPRVNKQNKETVMAKSETDSPSMLRLLIDRLAHAVRRPRVAQDGESDNDVREALWSALQALEPGFDGIQAVFPDDSLVIYSVWLAESDWTLYRRGYTIADGTATLAAEREQVEEVVEFRAVAATGPGEPKPETKKPESQTASPDTTTASASPGCSCGKTNVSSNTPTVASGNTPTGKQKGDIPMSNKVTDLVGLIVASEASPFTDENKDALAAFTEEQLVSVLAGYTKDDTGDPAPSTKVEGTGDGNDSPPPEPTEEEAIAALPSALREMIGRHQEQERVARASLITAIRAATDAYSEQTLSAKTTEDLNALSSALKLNEASVPDYSGQGQPHDPSADDVVDPPPSMADAIRAHRAAAN